MLLSSAAIGFLSGLLLEYTFGMSLDVLDADFIREFYLSNRSATLERALSYLSSLSFVSLF